MLIPRRELDKGKPDMHKLDTVRHDTVRNYQDVAWEVVVWPPLWKEFRGPANYKPYRPVEVVACMGPADHNPYR